MPTRRKKITRNRRTKTNNEIERFFITGKYAVDDEHSADIFLGQPWIYEAWEACKDRLMRENKKCAAFDVLEKGKGDFMNVTNLCRESYLEWKESR